MLHFHGLLPVLPYIRYMLCPVYSDRQIYSSYFLKLTLYDRILSCTGQSIISWPP